MADLNTPDSLRRRLNITPCDDGGNRCDLRTGYFAVISALEYGERYKKPIGRDMRVRSFVVPRLRKESVGLDLIGYLVPGGGWDTRMDKLPFVLKGAKVLCPECVLQRIKKSYLEYRVDCSTHAARAYFALTLRPGLEEFTEEFLDALERWCEVSETDSHTISACVQQARSLLHCALRAAAKPTAMTPEREALEELALLLMSPRERATLKRLLRRAFMRTPLMRSSVQTQQFEKLAVFVFGLVRPTVTSDKKAYGVTGKALFLHLRSIGTRRVKGNLAKATWPAAEVQRMIWRVEKAVGRSKRLPLPPLRRKRRSFKRKKPRSR